MAASDWIKMRASLQSHPKVVRILSATASDKFRVIGGLHAVWCVFDAHSADGTLHGYTTTALDHVIGWPGFAQAMVDVGWLVVESPQTIALPEFGEHNSASAKRRAEDTKQKKGRRASANCPQSVRNDGDESPENLRTREEKRREEEKHSVEASRGVEDPLPRDGDAQRAHKAPSPAAAACLALRAGGVHHVNPSHPDLLAAIAEGVTPDELRDAAAEAVQRGKPNLAYVVATVRGRRRDATAAAAIAPGTEIAARAHGPPQPRASPPSKARQILEQLHAKYREGDDGNDSEMVRSGDLAGALSHDLPGP